MRYGKRFAAARNWIASSLWFALAAATIHLSHVLFTRYVRHELTWSGREFMWMAPLSYIFVYVMVGSIGAIIAFYRLAAGGARPILVAFSWLLLFGALLLLVPGIHPLASAVLAAGLATRYGHLVPVERHRVPTLIQAAAIPAVLIGLFGGVEQVTRQWREDRTLAAQTPDRNQPSVVVIVLDAVRADNLSAYGYPEPTSPTLERLAAEGVLFERAFATAPWSLPSHAGLFTGLLPCELYADWLKPFSRKVPTLAEQLRARGMATGLFSANQAYVTWETGLTRGFLHLDDYALAMPELIGANVFEQTLSVEAYRRRGTPWMFYEHYRRDARQIVDRFLEWQKRLGRRPFFAFLNVLDAHEQPLVPDSEVVAFSRPGKSTTEASYDAAIARMDREIGRLVDSLKVRGVLDQTLLVVTADHGQLLGEHDLWYHGTSLYRRVLQVPLVLRFPSHIFPGRRIREVTSLRDLGANIRRLVAEPNGVLGNAAETTLWATTSSVLPGTAVAQVSQLAQGTHAPASSGPLDALIEDRWYYIEGPGENRELFDYVTDTAEAVNLALDPAYGDTVALLSNRLRRIAPRSAPMVGPWPN